MPYRGLGEFKAKLQFVTPANFPYLVNKAAEAKDVPSQTRYIQLALCTALARDLDLDEDDLIASLPPTRAHAAVLFGSDRKAISRRAARPGRS